MVFQDDEAGEKRGDGRVRADARVGARPRGRGRAAHAHPLAPALARVARGRNHLRRRLARRHLGRPPPRPQPRPLGPAPPPHHSRLQPPHRLRGVGRAAARRGGGARLGECAQRADAVQHFTQPRDPAPPPRRPRLLPLGPARSARRARVFVRRGRGPYQRVVRAAASGHVLRLLPLLLLPAPAPRPAALQHIAHASARGGPRDGNRSAGGGRADGNRSGARARGAPHGARGHALALARGVTRKAALPARE
mmetsp:Transcript_23524/g.56093  ORF Transcript_23524/g.56093 Transcript_23524/m.56093 type:complete len:251 (+) Transcript_23524:1216-1968(+)